MIFSDSQACNFLFVLTPLHLFLKVHPQLDIYSNEDIQLLAFLLHVLKLHIQACVFLGTKALCVGDSTLCLPCRTQLFCPFVPPDHLKILLALMSALLMTLSQWLCALCITSLVQVTVFTIFFFFSLFSCKGVGQNHLRAVTSSNCVQPVTKTLQIFNSCLCRRPEMF